MHMHTHAHTLQYIQTKTPGLLSFFHFYHLGFFRRISNLLMCIRIHIHTHAYTYKHISAPQKQEHTCAHEITKHMYMYDTNICIHFWMKETISLHNKHTHAHTHTHRHPCHFKTYSTLSTKKSPGKHKF